MEERFMIWNLFKSRPSDRQPRRNRRAFRPFLEQMEDRVVPALISWDGGAGNSNWTSAANWDTNTLPGPYDVAEIGSAFSGTTITTASAAITVSSVDSYANVVLSGGSFGARFASNFYGDFTQSGGTLTGVANFFGDFTWTGGTQGVGVTYVHSSMFISG